MRMIVYYNLRLSLKSDKDEKHNHCAFLWALKVQRRKD